jgi:hypothetical protein
MSANASTSPVKYWEPHPDLDPALAEEAHKAIARLSPSHFIHPVAGEVFDAHE